MSDNGGKTDTGRAARSAAEGSAEASADERLKQLEARIVEARKSVTPAPTQVEAPLTQANVGWKMVTELVAGLLIGFGIGFGLDTLFGTRPWLMIVFIGFGLAAGVQTMLRTAKSMQRDIAAQEAAKKGD